MTPRLATTAVFFVNGAVVGSWVAQIPWAQQYFDLSKSTMGLVILAMSVGVILAFPVAGQRIVRHGSRRMVAVGGALCVAALVPVLLMPHPILLAVALFVLGLANATMDVSMNAHGVSVEKALGRPIMSSLHAGWAFGGVFGAGFAAAGTVAGIDPRMVAAAAAVTLLAVLAACFPRLGAGSAGEGERAPGFTMPSRGVVLLAVLAFLVMITEGAMGDWGGLYLREDAGAAAGLAALAYAFFAGGMTLGRMVGDAVNHRVGPVALLRGGALLTALPLAAFLLIGTPAAGLVGLFLVGLGVANGVPLMFSAAGRRADTAPGPGIAAVSSMGSLGFLAGPPFIGMLADAVSLPLALATLVLGAVAVFALAQRATRQPAAGARVVEAVAA
ncbi:MAG TPA: MFS transporter [Solirubrobacteraceae bacterium]|nr:MFS transporter [Solirubrobacteraceae bacterium]